MSQSTTEEFKPRPSLRLIIITGGAISGKSLVVQRLYGLLPEDWRLVPLDNHIPAGVKLQTYARVDWKLGAALDGAAAVGHWRNTRKRVLVEGVADERAAKILAGALETTLDAPDCVVIQLQRSRQAAQNPLEADPTRVAEYAEMDKESVLNGFESQVPPEIPGAIQIQTDTLRPEEVLERVVKAISSSDFAGVGRGKEGKSPEGG